jgi:hypothetical protein
LEPDDYFFRPSVIVQQLCSYIKQTQFGEIVPDAAYELFASPTGDPLIAKSDYDRIVEHLVSKGYFVATDRHALRPGPQWQELYDERAIYTNLTDSRRMVEVIDETTGRKLGEIGWGIKPGMVFLFSGRTLRALHLTGRKLLVRPSAEDADREAPRLRAPWRPLNHHLARAVAAELGVPGADSPSTIAMVRETEESGAEATEEKSDETWVFHCAGEAYGLVLGDLLEARFKVRVQDCDKLCLSLQGAPPAAALQFSAEQVRARVRSRWQQLESWYDLGCFQGQLPLDVRRQAVLAAFNVEEFLGAFSGREIAEVRA